MLSRIIIIIKHHLLSAVQDPNWKDTVPSASLLRCRWGQTDDTMNRGDLEDGCVLKDLNL